MICQECKQNPATVRVIMQGPAGRRELFLCQKCARQHDELPPGWTSPFSFSGLGSLLGSLLGGEFGVGAGQSLEPASLPVCPSCGMTFREFTRTGRLGCRHCYEAFSERLDPLIRRIHGSTAHTGKRARRAQAHLASQRERDELQRQLEEAVRREDYELAARLRDRIRELSKTEGRS